MPVLDRLVEEHASCLGGPALLNSLHRASACGDEEVQRVVSRQPPAFCPQEEAESLTLSSLVCLHVGVVGEGRLQKACHAVLFRYIAAWSAHGRLLDSHNEFFIRPSYTASGQQGAWNRCLSRRGPIVTAFVSRTQRMCFWMSHWSLFTWE